MTAIKVYLDEDVHTYIAQALRLRGWVALTTEEAEQRGAENFDQTKQALSHATIHYISFPCSRKTPMSISRYIVVAAVKFSRACSGLPLRR